ncbi:MAG: ATP-binding protein [Dehalococcoidia bacterium]|nr:ATP-binding protein [Dehalococcoidia bacterium]
MPFQLDTEADVELLRSGLTDLPEPACWPFLLLVGGLPGAGKSYLSRQLAGRLPAVVLESDALRKSLITRPVYSWDESRRLFGATHELIRSLLGGGFNVIFDATNLQEAHREEVYRVAESAGAKTVTVWVEAPPDVIWRRMIERQQRLDPHDRSDADWEVYRRLSSAAQLPRRNYLKVDTALDLQPAIERIVRAARSAMGTVWCPR